MTMRARGLAMWWQGSDGVGLWEGFVVAPWNDRSYGVGFDDNELSQFLEAEARNPRFHISVA